MGGYIRPVSGQRLGKHIPEATVTHSTGKTGCYLRGPRRGVIKKRIGQPVQLIVSSQFCTELEHGSRGIATVESCYQATTSDDTAVWRRLSVE
jgi:hypothetical protein